jgi:hypothetical protein
MGNRLVLVLGLFLCACASSSTKSSAVVQQDLMPDAANGVEEIRTLAAFERRSPSDDMQGQPKSMRIYWFFGDR